MANLTQVSPVVDLPEFEEFRRASPVGYQALIDAAAYAASSIGPLLLEPTTASHGSGAIEKEEVNDGGSC